MTNTIDITAVPTPNPNSFKFIVDKVLVKSNKTYNFSDTEVAKMSPVAEKIFDIKGVTGVLIGYNFISITKLNAAEWQDIVEPATRVMREILAEEGPYIDEASYDAFYKKELDPKTSDIVKRIKDILENEIRPAIAMDGGDVSFHSFKDGVVSVSLQGACESCPSAVMTLKYGIENRLKEEIPEVLEVEQI